MLKEKIIFKDDVPVKVTVANIEEYPIHFHDDMELLYVLGGRVKLRNGYYTYTLKQGDVYIINDREMHSLETIGEPNMVMMLQIDLSYFSKYYDKLRNNFFVTDMEDDSDESIDVLRGLMARIMMELIQQSHGYEQRVIDNAHNLISCLVADFSYFVMDDGKFRNESRNKNNKVLAGRLNRITDYMYDNYNRKLTLGEIAEMEHLSIFYLSHIIKEASGLSFQDFLNYIRVEQSEKLLLGTNKKIGVIADETGFSAVRYYIKHFERWFGEHPADYRKKYIHKVISREIGARYQVYEPEKIEKAIKDQDKGVYSDFANRMKTPPVVISLDVYDENSEVVQGKPELGKIVERLGGGVFARLYDRLDIMGENLIASGINYMVTTECKYPGKLTSLSILIYGFDKGTADTLRHINSSDEIIKFLDSYNNEMEFLIRCNGMKGKFRVIRYMLDKNYFIRIMEGSSRSRKATSIREEVVNKMLSEPLISIDNLECSDSISVRSVFKGMGAELIMIDLQ